jgi:ligand-binding sensor domain-containing protein/signal transduction histidine kinase
VNIASARQLRLLVLLSAPFASLGPLYGLDPSRALTQYVHRIWQVPQGLPEAAIYSIWQTHDGYLWLGTQTGLVRFDGVRFTTFDSPAAPMLKNMWVGNLLEDRRQNLWIGGTEAGLFRLRDGVIRRFSSADGLPSDSVHCLVPARNGDLWVCTSQGLARIAGDKVHAYGAASGIPTSALVAAAEAPDGELWMAGERSRLGVWNGAAFRAYPLKSLPEFGSVRALLTSEDGTVWIGTTHGLIRLKAGQEHLFTVKDGLADNSIFSLAQSRDGSLWIGTKDGFSRMRNGEIESFHTSQGLSQSTAFAVHEDVEGDLWVGTKHGLNQFLDGRATPFTASEGLPSNDTGPVLEDQKHAIWVGTLDAGLGRFDGRRFSVLTMKDGLASNAIYALAEGASGDLWVGTGGGLNRLRDGRVVETFTVAGGLPSAHVQCLFRDHAGALWIGTSAGLVALRNGRLTPLPGAGSAELPILAIGEDKERRLFVATEGSGMRVLVGGRLREFAPDGIPLRDVDAFYQDPEGSLWMGTLGSGLRLWKDGKLFRYSVKDGLFDDEVYGIARDAQDRLWMACSKGIFAVGRSDLLRFAAGQIQSFQSTPYSPTDVLRTIECKAGVQPAAWKMQDGSLWFSTIRGLLVIDPRNLLKKLQPPEVVIEEVEVNGQSESADKIGQLPPGQKNIEFHYTGLSYRLPGRITFQHMLEGFDKSWIEAGTRREAYYANLPPGKYRFRVTACNVDGTCNSVGSTVEFALASHYYQRAWFLPLVALAAALVVWLVYQLRIREIKDHFRIILAERNRIARELHDTLIQGFSGVTMQMQALAARWPGSGERGVLEEIIQDAGACLREARRSVAGLRSSNGPASGLSAAIAQAARQITETGDVRLRLRLDQGPADLGAEAEYNLLRIAQEAVTNSLKHSGARTIEVALQSAADAVRLSVTDDGLGLSGRDGNYAAPGHYGLTGMRERAAQIGARLQLESQPGQGTTLRVVLPARKTSGAAPSAVARDRMDT